MYRGSIVGRERDTDREMEVLKAYKLLQYSDTSMKETHKLDYIRVDENKTMKISSNYIFMDRN